MLPLTNETRTVTDTTHSKVTSLQRRVINQIKKKMGGDMSHLFRELEKQGWTLRLLENEGVLPPIVRTRYRAIPDELLKAIVSTAEMVSPDEKAWFLCFPDYSDTSNSAYKWDEWEIQSLETAADDTKWQSEIRQFWDNHFPFLMSVKSGYAYYAVRISDGAVVCGEEPEFEEVTEVAPSLAEFMSKLQSNPSSFSRYI